MNMPFDRPQSLSHMPVLTLVVAAVLRLIQPSIALAQPDPEVNQQILASTDSLLTYYLRVNQGDIAISAIGSPAEVTLGPEYIKEYSFSREYFCLLYTSGREYCPIASSAPGLPA